MQIITNNKKANFDYYIISTLEAGIALVGSEVKSIRLGHVSLKDSYVTFSNGECFIKNMHVGTFEFASMDKVDEKRTRKLLLNRSEINKFQTKIKEKGFTCIPLKVYLKDSKVKLEIALAKGKHTYDKKNVLASKDLERETKREIKNHSYAK